MTGDRSVNSTLTINMAMLNDSGEYVCNASTPNYYDDVSSDPATVIVIGKVQPACLTRRTYNCVDMQCLQVMWRLLRIQVSQCEMIMSPSLLNVSHHVTHWDDIWPLETCYLHVLSMTCSNKPVLVRNLHPKPVKMRALFAGSAGSIKWIHVIFVMTWCPASNWYSFGCTRWHIISASNVSVYVVAHSS